MSHRIEMVKCLLSKSQHFLGIKFSASSCQPRNYFTALAFNIRNSLRQASMVPDVWASCLTWRWEETFKVSSVSVLKDFQWRKLFKEKYSDRKLNIGRFSLLAHEIHFSLCSFYLDIGDEFIRLKPWRHLAPAIC